MVPFRYLNIHSPWYDSDKEATWVEPIREYLTNEDVWLSKNTMLLGQVKVTPTAVDPLSGLDSVSGNYHAIVGHAKVRGRAVPTPSNNSAKWMTTTGAVTIENYTDSKAGYKGQFHHTLAAILVDVDEEGYAHIRHVHFNGDGFYDLDRFVTPDGIDIGHRIAALICGDIHVKFIDSTVRRVTFGRSEESMLSTLRPHQLGIHDLLDFYSDSHHARGNDLEDYSRWAYHRGNVEKEFQESADFLDELCGQMDGTIHVIPSNHNEHADRWLSETNTNMIRAENRQLFHWLKFHQYDQMKCTPEGYETISAFQFWCENPVLEPGLTNPGGKIQFHYRGESLMIAGIECGLHGDVGPNGARGSTLNIARMGSKTVVGHSHFPEIFEGCYKVGLSAMIPLNYTVGQPSSWLHTHCIIYPDGKRTLIHIANGGYRA